VAVDGEFDRGHAEEPPSRAVDMEVALGDMAARLALAGGGGLSVDVDVADRAARTTGCAGGTQADVDVGGDGVVTPDVEAQLPD
jgi:hypothetical protein